MTEFDLSFARIFPVVGVLSALIAMAAIAAPSSGATPATLEEATGSKAVKTASAPARSGAEILETNCAACHDTGVITATPHTADDWPVVVQRMIGNGANLSAEDRATLEAYLINTYSTPH